MALGNSCCHQPRNEPRKGSGRRPQIQTDPGDVMEMSCFLLSLERESSARQCQTHSVCTTQCRNFSVAVKFSCVKTCQDAQPGSRRIAECAAANSRPRRLNLLESINDATGQAPSHPITLNDPCQSLLKFPLIPELTCLRL